jgi:NADH-quinone oxidoreductase subunit N
VIPTPHLNFVPLLPELILAFFGILILLADAFLGKGAGRSWRKALASFAVVGILLAAAASINLWNWHGAPSVLAGMISTDKFAVVSRLIVLSAALLGTIFGYHYFEESGEARGEFFPLLLFATMGMTLITAADDLIIVFLALEILSLALYVLSGFSFRRSSGEAAMKYFLLGAFSSAFFLYGLAMTYGATGTTKITGVVHYLTGKTDPTALAFIAVALLLVGFCFKVAVVPFHMWTPDVYQGAPTAVVSFMSAGTKVAAFCALIRVLDVAFQPLTWNWQPVVWTLAGLTVVVGALFALAQSDIKRMLAYSSIAHAGFILIGISSGNSQGIEAALFYLVSYALMIAGAFGIVMLVSGRGERDTSLTAYQGLGRRQPVLGALLGLFLLSLAGIPPMAGFLAKVAVFTAGVQAGAWPLVLLALLASVVAAFFYLRVIMLMYMKEPVEVPAGEGAPVMPIVPAVPVIAAAIPAVLLVLFGVFPGLITGFLHQASVILW